MASVGIKGLIQHQKKTSRNRLCRIDMEFQL